jgi:hypothetical protein
MSDQQDLERMVQAERLLDRALAHYSREPIAGFERRMVNRLQLEAGASATLWRRKRVAQAAALVTLFAITAAASLFIGLYLGQRQANVVWQHRLNELTAISAALSSDRTPQPGVDDAADAGSVSMGPNN